MPNGLGRTGLALIAAFACSACASPPEIYEPTRPYYAEHQFVPPGTSPQLEQGRRIAPLDGLNHYVLSLPTKLLLWNWHVLDHRLPDRSRELLEDYLAVNRLTSVKVRHNQYDPVGELQRLFRNRNVGLGYRATLGIVSWLQYTLLPGRLLAGLPLIGLGDHFNPFSNTINVYSSDAAVLLHEAGHAKDYVQHEMRGTSFAALRLLPGVDLIQEAAASNDAIRFLHCRGEREEELHAYATLIPAYSTYVAGYVPGGLVATIPVVVAGHITGRMQARAQRAARARDSLAHTAHSAVYGAMAHTCATPDEDHDENLVPLVDEVPRGLDSTGSESSR